ncbi:hypothetical protein HIM_10426 [Hirsutella minnesotensis 3608]|uniref:Uncharacterized protein n=1 Tax=Hirsutella minnesotensis 3608 TaxID=1043627 RepID=A0A0F7ZW15_9HYPO|nr:hypothetical protein HIM_12426 [Hirsutella minnesotensis 3608]KJZ70166.1 hypothetical protein HIM_10426 [Hirsutella minnesotensis 3608]
MSIFHTDPILVHLREEANNRDEWASTRLFSRYFTRHIFSEIEWIHGTEVPPREHHSQLRMDIAVQHFETGQRTLMFRLIGQAKKGRATPAKIVEVEVQAYQLCQAYMMDKNIQSVWAITYFGSKARLWACELKGSGWLDPFYPLEGAHGERDAYRDIFEFESEFLWAFQKIKAISVPDPDNFDEIYAGEESSTTTQALSGSFYTQNSTEAYDLAEPSVQAHDSLMDVDPEPTSTLARIVNGSEYDSVQVSKVANGWTTCKLKNGTKVEVRCSKWDKAIIINRDGSRNTGYVAETTNNKYRTWDDPVGKGKGKSRK